MVVLRAEHPAGLTHTTRQLMVPSSSHMQVFGLTSGGRLLDAHRHSTGQRRPLVFKNKTAFSGRLFLLVSLNNVVVSLSNDK